MDIYFIPREGSQIWVDNLAVPAQAPHQDLAEKFINYLLDGKVSARISNFTQYSTPNKAAVQFLRPEDLKNPILYPLPEVRQKLEVLEDLGVRFDSVPVDLDTGKHLFTIDGGSHLEVYVDPPWAVSAAV